jgi:hypothetical protein
MVSNSTLHRVCSVLTTWLHEGCVHDDPGLTADEWTALIAAARVHGVGPRINPMLSKLHWLPPKARRWFEFEEELNRRRIEALHREGVAILRDATERGISVLPLKGLALAAYVPCWRRPMADIDVLVQPDQSGELDRLLGERGFSKAVSKTKHDEYLTAQHRDVVCEDHEHPDNPSPVEVHRHCEESFARTVVDLSLPYWSSARCAVINGIEVEVPSPEALWAHLLVHAGWNWWFGGGRLVQLLDLIDLWPQVRDGEYLLAGIDPGIALLALSPADRIFPGRLPNELMKDLRHRAGSSATRLADGFDPVNSSHLSSRRWLMMRVLRLHMKRPLALTRAVGWIFAPTINEMHINHQRVPRGLLRRCSYPGLWLWHLTNLAFRV